ncbi:DUF1566 domain-containing protein [Desulfobacter latus]|uniref:DUF1566 domain-containing protein n=1 Tax=Desulfobacter latus TaxID=2292 RepID=A0A850SWI9_9BACT|nr:DUF1566 domain-containing protein [Desulfobacter latus]NWH05509.1 DUF1566 domain-containing protein [Desulfobacter latus]
MERKGFIFAVWLLFFLTLNTPILFAGGSYIDNTDGTVSDSETALMWQQQDDDQYRNWVDALGYCENLSLAGYDDWRLPNIRELETLVDDSRYDPAIDTDYFTGCHSSYYWSGSSYARYSSDAWGVSFNDGYVYYGHKADSYYVRCVRCGRSAPSGPDDLSDLKVTYRNEQAEFLTVHFSASFKGGEAPFSYVWDFGDNTSSTDENPTHRYNSEGEYTATLTVTDQDNNTILAKKSISISYPDDDLVASKLEYDNGRYYVLSNQGSYMHVEYDKFMYADSYFLNGGGTDETYNDIAASLYGAVFVGSSGSIFWSGGVAGPVYPQAPDKTPDFLSVATDASANFIIAGSNGTLLLYNCLEQTLDELVSGTQSDINQIIYDVSAERYLAVTGSGELLSSANGIDWAVQKISNTPLTAVSVKADRIVAGGTGGTIYEGTLGGQFQTSVVNTTDDIVDIVRIGKRFIAATRKALLISEDGKSWLIDTQDFSKTPILDLAVNGGTLKVVKEVEEFEKFEESGIESISRFQNVRSGVVKTATLAGVDIEFGKSTVVFEDHRIKTFHIEPDDCMYIKKDGETIARIDFGDDTQFKNSSTLASIYEKDKANITISGSGNTLYYNSGDGRYTPVSQGSFCLKNGKVTEQNLLNEVDQNTISLVQSAVDAFVASYTDDYNAASSEEKQWRFSPDMMRNVLESLFDLIGNTSNFDVPLTGNHLLLGGGEPFSPSGLTFPFFRRLYLDTEDGKIYQKKSYMAGPSFLANAPLTTALISKVEIPEIEYVLDGTKLTGTVTDYKPDIGPFSIVAKKARIESFLGDDGGKESSIIFDEAGFFLKSKLENFQKTNSNQSATLGSKVSKLKITHSRRNGFKLVSGEAGAEIKIPNLNLTKTWVLEDLSTYITMVFREARSDGLYVYNDDYPDELDQFLITLGGNGTLRRRSAPGYNLNSDLKLSAGLDLAFDWDSFSLDGPDKQNLLHASLAAQNFINFPKAGVFSLTGIGGEYNYSKYGSSYWSLTGDFKLYKLYRNIFLFEGGADITADTGMDSFGLGLTYLHTPVLNTSLYIDWAGSDDLGCLLLGSIRHDMPVKSPDIENCDGSTFDLKPKDEKTVFHGFGMGIQAGMTLKEDKTKKVYSLFGAKFENLIKGAVGFQIFGTESCVNDDYQVSLKAVGKEELRLPKIDKDWFFIPESFKNGKVLGNVCVSLGYFQVTQEYKEWFSDKEANLGKHFGMYATAEKIGTDGVTLFIPFDNLEDKDGDRVPFAVNLKIKSVNYTGTQSIYDADERTALSRTTLGAFEFKTFNVGKNEPFIIVDLISADNTMTLTLPDGTVINQDSADTGVIDVEKVGGKFTEITVFSPPEGAYEISYVPTGNEEIRIFGGNPQPDATLEVDGDNVLFSLTDADGEQMEYTLSLIDENENIVHILEKNENTQGGDMSAEIGTITHISTGDYRVMLNFKDPVNPVQKVISTAVVHLVKSIPVPSDIKAVSTSDYVLLSWPGDPGVSGYEVSIMTREQEIVHEKIAGAGFKVTDLMEGEYTAWINGYDEEGNSGDAGTISFTVSHVASDVIPAAVDGINVQINEDNAVVSWSAAENAGFYTVDLYKGMEPVFTGMVITEPAIVVDKAYLGTQLQISITSHTVANNASEVFRDRIQLYSQDDTDSDGLPDMWEIKQFDTIGQAGTDDYDGDGWDNTRELAMHTDPCIADSDSDRLSDSVDPHPLNNDDTNENFIADDWENYYGIVDIMADNDNDGYLNYLEYMADMDPTMVDWAGIDLTSFEQIDYMPVVVANLDEITMVKLNAEVTLDLSNSFDINGNELSFAWKLNSNNVEESAKGRLDIDTSKTGMNRVEVNISDGSKTVYKKYAVFVTDGKTRRVDAGAEETSISLERFDVTVPSAAMAEDSYLVAGDISLEQIPVSIMGRKIVSDGLIYLYSGGSKFLSPITIQPYVNEYEMIDPYVFNYSTSVWTNLTTGETFDPVYNRTVMRIDPVSNYTVKTKETGILVFAKVPAKITLTPLTTLKTGNRIYQVDLAMLMAEKGLETITDITVSDSSIISVNQGDVSGNKELRLEVLSQGVTCITVAGTKKKYGNRSAYHYIIGIIQSPGDLDTDADTIDDDWELLHFGGLEKDGTLDYDNDGVSDLSEFLLLTDPLNPDTDGDKLQDGTELGYTLGDITEDTDPSVFQPDLDPSTTTDPLKADTDGDGFKDGFEDFNGNGRIDTDESDPNDPESVPLFKKGDVNADMLLNLNDPVLILKILTAMSVDQDILLSADADNDGIISIKEVIYILDNIK